MPDIQIKQLEVQFGSGFQRLSTEDIVEQNNSWPGEKAGGNEGEGVIILTFYV